MVWDKLWLKRVGDRRISIFVAFDCSGAASTSVKQEKTKSLVENNRTIAKENETKELPVLEIMLKAWCSQSDLHKIWMVILENKGWIDSKLDWETGVIKIKGKMDPNIVMKRINENLKKPVEIF